MRKDGRIVAWETIGGFTTYVDTMDGKDAVANSFACAVVDSVGAVAGRSQNAPRLVRGLQWLRAKRMVRARTADESD